MPCPRCHGFSIFDWVYVPEGKCAVWRCLSCGNILDPVIVQNRTRKEDRANDTLDQDPGWVQW